MSRTGIFVDTANLYFNIRYRFPNRNLNYASLLKICPGNHVHKFAYGTRRQSEARSFTDRLKYLGFETKFIKYTHGRRVNLNVDLTMDAVRVSDKIDTVILCTSDRDIEPLVSWLKNKGIKVYIISACIPFELKDSADHYSEITEDLLEKQNYETEKVTDSEGEVS